MKAKITHIEEPVGHTVHEPYYYMPKSFLTDTKLTSYSLDSKLLVGILLSTATTGKAVMETAQLINELGSDNINQMFSDLKMEIGE